MFFEHNVLRLYYGRTVSTNVSLALKLPSLTVNVIVAVPVWSDAGATVTVRFAPIPAKTMFPSGTKPVFDELPLRVRLPAAASTSPTVTGIAGVGVFTAVDWSFTSVIVG